MTTYRERPYLRKRILKYLAAHPDRTLEDYARRYYITRSGEKRNLFCTDGWRIQCHKMLAEQKKQKPKKPGMDLNFERLLADCNQNQQPQKLRSDFEPYSAAEEFLTTSSLGLIFNGSTFRSGDKKITREILKGKIAEYLHCRGWQIKMQNLNLVILCLQTICSPKNEQSPAEALEGKS